MKKFFLIAVAALGMMTANAQQQALEATNFGSNWSIGLDGGATSPLKGHGFLKNARGVVGLHLDKQISPVFGLGVEGAFGINTSGVKTGYGVLGTYGHSKCVFDNSYVGVYGTANLNNLFAGYNCNGRVFEIEAVAGAGWGHFYQDHGTDNNWFETKAGLNFNFNVCRSFTIALKPSVSWNMTDRVAAAQTSCAYDVRNANFNLMVGLTYHMGNGFVCVDPYNSEEIAALNAQINGLRAQLDGCMADLAASTAALAAVQAELDACLKRPAQVIEKVKDNLESVRYVYFAQSSSVVTAEQMRTVDIIASFMKNHNDSKCDIKGYASPEGNLDFNNKLAAARAESVKKALVKKGIAADRIAAQGEGIGRMFSEPSWNRVAICTLDK